MGRIMLHGSITNIQTSWVKLGVDGTRAMLQAGANDVGGTLMEETISRMAGSEHGSAKTVAELVEIGAGIGRPVVERTTTYRHLAHGINGTTTSGDSASARAHDQRLR
jgi:FO synthase